MSIVGGPEFLSVKELAARYAVSEATVYSWLHKGSGPRSYKIGRYRRFKLADVISWEESMASTPHADAP